MMDLPYELKAALEQELMGIPLERLKQASQHLTQRYHQDARTFARHDDLRTQHHDLLAYAVARMPATYGAVDQALAQIENRLDPGFAPTGMLDVGAGPGTATWAACQHWPSLQTLTLVEQNPGMAALGQRLQQQSDSVALFNATWIKTDALAVDNLPPADLIVASYLLGELEPNLRFSLVQRLWQLKPAVLLLVEPGTPDGFSTIRTLRSRLVADGANIIAPCPHGDSCPIPKNDWCHFAARIGRSRMHRQVKTGTLGYEDEKFSYVAFASSPTLPATNRIIRHPTFAKGHVDLSLCTEDGLVTRSVTAKDRTAYRAARHARWGDEF